jgi:transposase
LYKELVEKLCQILYLEEQGLFKVYYGDQSGFSLNPCLPYGWQPKGEYVRICPKKSKRLNVFGLLSKDNDLQVYSTNGTVSSDLMIAFLDDFAKQIKQKTVVVLDNAPIHHSDEFQEQIAIWEEQDLHIFFLPTYSPHLNIIERLWLKAKYEWLKPHHYESFETLTNAVEEILNQVGSKFKIDFGEIKHFTEFKTAFKFE